MKIKQITFLVVFLLLSINFNTFTYVSEDKNKTLSIAFNKQSYSLNFIKEFNHTELHIHSAIYSGLLTANPNTLEPEVGLAISWFSNSTKDEYTFNLRNNLVFSDGSPITTQDVKESWLSSIKSKNAFISLFELISGVSEYIKNEASINNIGIIIINNRTIKIKLKNSTPYFLSVITHPAFSVTSKKQLLVEDWDKKPKDIICSGPFIVASSSEDKLILKKNPKFWSADSIYFNFVEINFYKEGDDEKLTRELNAGNIQWSTFYSETKTALDKKEWLLVHPIFGTKYLYFSDTQKKPWDNPEIRTAIKLLLPLDPSLDDKYPFPTGGLVPKIQGVYEPEFKISVKDKERAFKLLEDNGYPKGRGLGKISIFVPEYQDGTHEAIFDLFHDILSNELETEVELKTSSSQSYYDDIQNVQYTLGVSSWIGDFADPAAFLQLWASPNKSLGHNYNNKEYQDLLIKSQVAVGDARIEALIKAEKYLLEKTVVIPMHNLFVVNVVRTDLLKGWSVNLLDLHVIGAMYFVTNEIPQNITLGPSKY